MSERRKKGLLHCTSYIIRKFDIYPDLPHFSNLWEDEALNLIDESEHVPDLSTLMTEHGTTYESSSPKKQSDSFEDKRYAGSRRFAICEEHEKLIYIAPKTNLRDFRRFLVKTLWMESFDKQQALEQRSKSN